MKNPNTTWTTRSGKQIEIRKLEDSHLLRILNGGFCKDQGQLFSLVEEARCRNLDVRNAWCNDNWEYDGPDEGDAIDCF